MSETIEKQIEGSENEIGQLDPSGFIRITGIATGEIDIGENHPPIEVVGSPAIRASFGHSCLVQAMAAASAPGVRRFILNMARRSWWQCRARVAQRLVLIMVPDAE